MLNANPNTILAPIPAATIWISETLEKNLSSLLRETIPRMMLIRFHMSGYFTSWETPEEDIDYQPWPSYLQ